LLGGLIMTIIAGVMSAGIMLAFVYGQGPIVARVSMLEPSGTVMVLLGILGASVGAGIQQAMQMVGGQGLGFISGEWCGVRGTPRRQVYLAIATLIVATIVMACANILAN
jgi:hypothetical protein